MPVSRHRRSDAHSTGTKRTFLTSSRLERRRGRMDPKGSTTFLTSSRLECRRGRMDPKGSTNSSFMTGQQSQESWIWLSSYPASLHNFKSLVDSDVNPRHDICSC